MMEAMSEGGFKKRGALFAPHDCLEGNNHVVLRYVRNYIDRIEILKPHSRYDVNGLKFNTSGRHRHPGEVYGFVFEGSKGKVAFLTDTEFFPDLVDWYAGARVLVLNVVRLKQHEHRVIQHLCLADARQLIAGIKPEVAILTHFGMTMIRAKPWLLAEHLSTDTGVKVIAASDGLRFSLDEL